MYLFLKPVTKQFRLYRFHLFTKTGFVVHLPLIGGGSFFLVGGGGSSQLCFEISTLFKSLLLNSIISDSFIKKCENTELNE